MKKCFTLILTFSYSAIAMAQIQLTEIMYNPPESGTDSLEYLEIYNASSDAIDLDGYSFSAGINHSFGSVMIGAGEYLVVCVDGDAFESVFGFSAMQWDNGALQNGGELIELMDGSGVVQFTVDYDDSGDWPGSVDGTDGEGASIELCDTNSDSSNPFNWSASDTASGIMLNGREIRATPGAANNVVCREDVEISYTQEEIVNARITDTDGFPIRFGDFLELNGIVYGANLNTNGLYFTIIDDSNNGIGVSHPDDDLGYTVAEGDHVQVFGQVVQFSGQVQLEVDSISIQSSSNTLLDAEIVSELEEDTESSLVKLENLSLVDANQWEADGGSFNVMVTNGTDEFQLRIWAATDMSELAAPEGLMSVTGIGGQFDTSSPFTEGYQLIPRYAADIEADTFGPGETIYNQVSITDINGEEADGSATSDGDLVEVTATSYGFNFRPGGLQFTIIDVDNNGIGVFSSSDTWGYEFSEGDELTVWGEVEQFSGLTQIRLDSISLLSSDNDLVSARGITELDESTESSFLVFVATNFVDENDWAGDGSSFNADMTDGNNVITLRVDADSELATEPIPDGASFVYGIGGQFDSSAPFDSGYQMAPLRFEPYLSTIDILNDSAIQLIPNPTADYVQVESDIEFSQYEIISMSGKQLIRTVNSKIFVGGLLGGSYVLIARSDKYLASKVIQIH